MKKEQFDSYEDHFLLKRRTKLAFGISGLGQTTLQDVVNNFILLLYNTQLMVPARWIGIVFSIARFWDAISGPFVGHLSDNTRTRWGRRRPYILVGGFLTALLFCAICIPPRGLGQVGHLSYLLVTTLLYYGAFNVAVVPLGGLGAELSMDYHERTRLNAYRTFMARIGALVAGSCWWLAGKFENFQMGFVVVGVGFAILGFLSFLTVFTGTRENAEFLRQAKVPFFKGFKATLTNRAFWMLAGMVFFLLLGVLLGFPAANYINIYYVFGGDSKAAGSIILINTIVFNAVSLFTVAPITKLSIRVGKERCMLLGMGCFALAPLVSWFIFNPSYPYLQVLFQVPLGIAFTTVALFSGAMVADLIDLDEVKTHQRRAGSYSSVLALIFKLASPVGILGFTYLLDLWARFNPELPAQTPQTIVRLRLMLFAIPLLPLSIAVLIAFLYPIREKQVREVRALLEERRRENLATQEHHGGHQPP